MTYEQSEAAHAAAITFEKYREEVTEIAQEVLAELEDMELDMDAVALDIINGHHWMGSVHTALAILRHSPNANHAFEQGIDIARDDWRLFNKGLAGWALFADVADALTDPTSSLAI